MQSRRVGQSSLEVSAVGLGCNNFGWLVDAEGAAKIVGKALDLGVTLFDTADMYGDRGRSEEILGESLAGHRQDVVLATKFGYPMGEGEGWRGASRRYVMTALEASLKRLNTDWIDLYQLHIPDPATPIEETLRALDDAVRQGKVRHVGVCNMAAWQVVDAAWTSRAKSLAPPIACQAEYSLLAREVERELLPALESQGISLLPFFPLAGGLLTGKYARDKRPAGARLSSGSGMATRFLTEQNFDRVDALTSYAETKGHSLLELAFAWLLARPSVCSVIAGATSAAQIEQNVAAGAWRLTDGERAEVDALAA